MPSILRWNLSKRGHHITEVPTSFPRNRYQKYFTKINIRALRHNWVVNIANCAPPLNNFSENCIIACYGETRLIMINAWIVSANNLSARSRSIANFSQSEECIVALKRHEQVQNTILLSRCLTYFLQHSSSARRCLRGVCDVKIVCRRIKSNRAKEKFILVLFYF